MGALLARTALVLSIAALPVAFNAWIDPARLVAPRAAEREIARVLASGRAVTDFANYDDRAIERHLAPLRRGQPDVLVLGSSRMQVLRGCGGAPVRQCANGFVNGAMQGATLDDVLGVYGLYDVAERRPRRVVLGVDPWTESLSGTGWRSVADERALVMRRAGIPGSPRREQLAVWARSVRTLATPEYFRLALYSFRRHGTRGIEWRPTDAERNAGKTKLPDGAVVWTDASPERAAAAARAFATNGITLDERFRDLERRAVGRDGALERFVRYLGGEGVGVTLVLVPFAPEVYDAARRLPGRTIVEVERELLAMAARTKVQIVGSYDPRAVGMTTREFFDESHPRPEALARVVGQAVRAP
ncbi:MAG TPA: hypothetical protein VFS59_00480 [Gemmatimonadaceae bacterium]|nr:hypothetical protein [Gemmatimonadaceae bacterium]